MPASLQKLTDYAITARYLKPSQVYHRARSVLRQRLLHRSKAYRAWCQSRGTGSETVRPLEFSLKGAKAFDLEAMQRGEFTFLNRHVHLGDPVEWFPPEQSRLWVFHLHSFEYALALSKAAAEGDRNSLAVLQSLVESWIDACPAAESEAWHSYPTSLRIVHWIKAYSHIAGLIDEDGEFARRMRQSIYAQTCFLAANIEYDLLNNHLLENGRALLFSGHFFDGGDAKKWQRTATRILEYGLREHVLADGSHNELSPMYHQIVLELYQDAAEVFRQRQQEPPVDMSEKIASMQQWLRCTLHPDGKIPLLNDAAFGIAPEPDESLDGDLECPDGFHTLEPSGLFSFRQSDQGNLLLFDAGPIGPDHQPGHGHCDALSFELSLEGQRIITDSGVEQYHDDQDWRKFYRSTRAHNTVAIDGEEQSEIWGSFRVARRARPTATHWSQRGNELSYVTSGHTGYQRLPQSPLHRRFVCWVDRRFWLVCDRFDGGGEHELQSFLHFHPEVEIVEEPEITGELSIGVVRRDSATLQVVPWLAGSSGELGPWQDFVCYRGSEEPIQGWYAPEFGRRLPRTTWCSQGTYRLPAWAGYLLWPETSPVSLSGHVTRSASGNDICRVNVNTDDRVYSLVFGESDVELAQQRVPHATAITQES